MFSARLFLYFRRSARQFTMKTSAQKNRHIHLSGRVYERFFLTKLSFALSLKRRESFERRFSCEETVCRPHPTPQVFQTDIESRQTHSQCHRLCQLSEVANAKLSWMKRVRFKFCVCDARSLAVGNYSCCTTIRYDTRCYFNVRSKADISQLNLPHGTDN